MREQVLGGLPGPDLPARGDRPGEGLDVGELQMPCTGLGPGRTGRGAGRVLVAAGQPDDADHGTGREVAVADRAGDERQAQSGPVGLPARVQQPSVGEDHGFRRFSIIFAPTTHVVHGRLTLMLRIQSPAGGGVVVMRLDPTRLCPAGRRGGR